MPGHDSVRFIYVRWLKEGIEVQIKVDSLRDKTATWGEKLQFQ